MLEMAVSMQPDAASLLCKFQLSLVFYVGASWEVWRVGMGGDAAEGMS